MSLDVMGYLKSVNIDIAYSGKNVGSNDIAINCPWCGDESNHLTIHKSKGLMNCWVCNFDEYKSNHPKGWSPNFKSLIREIEKCSWEEVNRIWERIGGEINYNYYSDSPKKEKICKLPPEALSFDNPGPFKGARDYAFNYLMKRGFTKYHVKKYKLLFCPAGDYMHRIIIPIYYNGEIVNWISRKYHDSVKVRYLNCKIEECSIRLSEILYGEQDFDGDIIRIVEGVFDKMRIGDSALSLNRSRLSKRQRDIIIKLSKKTKYTSIILDHDADIRALTIAEDLSPFIPYIKIIKLPKNCDPANLSFESIINHEKNTEFMSF